MSWSGTASTHVWNIFLNTEEKETQIANGAAATPYYSNYTPPGNA
jgi:hypothetical protein